MMEMFKRHQNRRNFDVKKFDRAFVARSGLIDKKELKELVKVLWNV